MNGFDCWESVTFCLHKQDIIWLKTVINSCVAHASLISLKPLGDFKAHPKDVVIAPCWLKGFKGNELQRLIQKKKMVGDRMMTEDRHNLEKRIRFLYRRFNRTGKHR